MDYYLGQLNIFPYSFTPKGWMLCDGRALKIVAYSALFSLISTKFGGDGKSDFKIPNLQGAETLPGTAYYICISGRYPERE